MPSKTYEDAEKRLKDEEPYFRPKTKPQLLTAIYLKYFICDGEQTEETFETCFTDGSNDLGIDAIVERDDQQEISVVQSKRTDSIDYDTLQNAFHKLDDALQTLENSVAPRCNERLFLAYDNKIRAQTQNTKIELVFVTTGKIKDDLKERVHKSIQQSKLDDDYKIKICDRDEIDNRVLEIDQKVEWVKHGEFDYDKHSGVVKYGMPGNDVVNGYICSVKASHLRKLFIKYRNYGLFSQNLRRYIPNTKVDQGIDHTIKNNPNEFWFKNNGITIACGHVDFDGHIVKIDDFSVINGGQTLHRLGNNTFDDDFWVVCKIIEDGGADKDRRLLDIAKATNYQKAIKDQDFRANDEFQKKWKRDFQSTNPRVYLKIKRGDQDYPKGLIKWRTPNNQVYGQLVLSFHLQKPYSARSSAAVVFSDDNTYRDIFVNRQFDIETEVDLLRLNQQYEDWRSKKKASADEFDSLILQYGKFSILANCGVILKDLRRMIDLKTVIEDKSLDLWSHIRDCGNLVGQLFLNRSDYLSEGEEQRLNYLFNWLFIRHRELWKSEVSNVVANYKSPNSYKNKILKRVVEEYIYARDFGDLKDTIQGLFL